MPLVRKRFMYAQYGRRMKLHRRRRLKKGGGMSIMRPIKQNYFITKIRGNFAEQGGNVNGQPLSAAFLLNYPLYYRNTQGVVNPMLAVSNHYVRAFNLFDEYKVISLKVQARHVITQIAFLGNEVAPTGNAIYPIVYTTTDDDSDELLVGLQSCLTGVGVRRQQLMTGKAITRYMKPKGKIDKSMWFNTGIPNPNNIPDQPGQLTYQMPKRGSVKFWFENAVNNEIGWDFFAEWTVMFKGLNLAQPVDAEPIASDIEGTTGTSLPVAFDPVVP